MNADEIIYHEAIETNRMSDRELMLATFHEMREVKEQLRTLNGKVADHHIEIYGSPDTQVVGLKAQTLANTQTIKTSKVIFATLASVVSIVGVGNLIAMLTLITRLTGSTP